MITGLLCHFDQWPRGAWLPTMSTKMSNTVPVLEGASKHALARTQPDEILTSTRWKKRLHMWPFWSQPRALRLQLCLKEPLFHLSSQFGNQSKSAHGVDQLSAGIHVQAWLGRFFVDYRTHFWCLLRAQSLRFVYFQKKRYYRASSPGQILFGNIFIIWIQGEHMKQEGTCKPELGVVIGRWSDRHEASWLFCIPEALWNIPAFLLTFTLSASPLHFISTRSTFLFPAPLHTFIVMKVSIMATFTK